MLVEKNNNLKSGFSVMNSEEVFLVNGGEQILAPYDPSSDNSSSFAEEHPVAWTLGHIVAGIAFAGHEPSIEQEMCAQGWAMTFAGQSNSNSSSSSNNSSSSSSSSGSSSSGNSSK